jgi:hypothetical protein
MRPREWLLLPNGSLQRVITVDGELLPLSLDEQRADAAQRGQERRAARRAQRAAWSAEVRSRSTVVRCACGKPVGAYYGTSARSCGSPECVARLWAA